MVALKTMKSKTFSLPNSYIVSKSCDFALYLFKDIGRENIRCETSRTGATH